MDIFDLSKKIVVLTGGLGLIGKEVTRALLEKGARVHVLDIMTGESSDHLVYHTCDITDKSALLRVREEIMKTEGRIDVLITNAALNPKVEGSQMKSTTAGFEELSLEEWNREIAVNLTGTMLCCQVFGSVMTSGGSIVTIASTYGIVAPDQHIYPAGFVKPATYGVTKGGVIALTKYLAAYWGEKGIRVNCVAPGGVENSQDEAFIQKYSARTPLGRMAKAHESNGIIIYLASDASSYSTGAVYSVDGGWTAW